MLDTLRRLIDRESLVPFTIEEGIRGYNREDQTEQLISLTGIYNIIKSSFKQSVGYTLDDMMTAANHSNMNVSACTFCGGFRRKLINDAARRVGADAVVTGHNLDDEVQTIVINLLRGDVERLIRFGNSPLRLSDRFVPRLKPLRRIYEWETTMYAELSGYKFQDVECPYMVTKPTLRAKVRELLYQLESTSPGSLLKILDVFDGLSEKMRSSSGQLPSLPLCRICGEPTSLNREICKNCELLLKSGLLDMLSKSIY